MHPSCLLFQAVLIVDELCILCLSKNRCKARESCRVGQIAQLEMVKTLRKGDEKNYVPKYCCLFLLFFREKVVFSSLRQGTLVLGATLMPSSIFRASEQGAELVPPKKKKNRGWGADLIEMRSNICDVDTLLRNCQYVKRTIAFSTLSFIRSGSDSV